MKRTAVQLGAWTATFGIITCLLSGCAWSIGGGHKEHGRPAEYAQPTRGQELLDLKKARDQGALTEDEYQAQKKRLLGQ
jgi:putative oligomerization/nucleic acid binding protein